ncbi:hypothetical protein KW797_01935 [Candidatus Parcubacteria bacterium]|nr:hypothetical protein [Candidatus Parcubacteria bacterium]
MPSLQLVVRKAEGISFGGSAFARGSIVTTSTDEAVFKALTEVGADCDIFRTVSPGGQIPLDQAIKETLALNLPASADFGGLKSVSYVDPPTADDDAYRLSTATAVGTTVYQTTGLNGVLGPNNVSVPARNITCTTGSTATDAPNQLVVDGTDIDGNALQETITLSRAAQVDSGAKCFRTVSKLTLNNGVGTGGTIKIGFGPIMGIPFAVKERSTKPQLVVERLDGAPVATAATLVAKVTSPPYGSISPNSAANAARDYDFTFEKA